MSTVLLGALEVRLGLGALLLVGAQRREAGALTSSCCASSRTDAQVLGVAVDDGEEALGLAERALGVVDVRARRGPSGSRAARSSAPVEIADLGAVLAAGRPRPPPPRVRAPPRSRRPRPARASASAGVGVLRGRRRRAPEPELGVSSSLPQPATISASTANSKTASEAGRAVMWNPLQRPRFPVIMTDQMRAGLVVLMVVIGLSGLRRRRRHRARRRQRPGVHGAVDRAVDRARRAARRRRDQRRRRGPAQGRSDASSSSS